MKRDIAFDTVIIGGGAAGLLAGGLLSRAGLSVAIVEKKRLATKIRITGKGRCNLTNNCTPDEFIANVIGGKRFMYSCSRRFTPAHTMELFESLGVSLKTERGARVFPVSDDANQIADTLIKYASACKVIYAPAKSVEAHEGAVTGVVLSKGEIIPCKTVLLACGGGSYPGTGSTGDGYQMAGELGHTVVTPAAALCGIELKGSFFKELQGLSLKNVSLHCKHKGKDIFHEQGEAQFTHFGISGPIVLTLSSHINRLPPEELSLYVDFKPALTSQVLDRRLLREIAEGQNRELKTMLCRLLPQALTGIVAEACGGNVKLNSLTASQRARLVEVLKGFPLPIKGLRPIAEGIVTAGGVSTREIDPKTMESKLVKGLYFAGEVMDIDALTGGYNLQAAFSTAFAAATDIISLFQNQ